MSQAGVINIGGSGTGVVQTLTGNTGGAVPPTAGNINVLGAGNLTVSGNAGTSTLTISENSAVLITSYKSIAFADSPYTVLDSDYYISVDTSGGAITIRFPNAPTTLRSWIVKDRTGNALANNITLTTVGGAVLIDGATSKLMNINHQADEIMFNATSFEIY